VQSRRPIIAVVLLLITTLLGACVPAMGESAPPPDNPAASDVAPVEPAIEVVPPPPPPRSVTEQPFTPFADVEGVTLYHPAARVERVGFHEANHDGARPMVTMATTVSPMTLESRKRGTGSRTAADIVSDPAGEIRAPVTGTVIRGGSYILYCNTRDYYVVIEPDERPGWEVKVLHMTGLNVQKGQRVTARETVLAPGPHQLPFESQVDKARTADPAWPHVHIEVVDPSIPDRPSPGGRGC